MALLTRTRPEIEVFEHWSTTCSHVYLHCKKQEDSLICYQYHV